MLYLIDLFLINEFPFFPATEFEYLPERRTICRSRVQHGQYCALIDQIAEILHVNDNYRYVTTSQNQT